MYVKSLRLPTASILVLEEDPGLRATLCELLSAAGYAHAPISGEIDRVDVVLVGIGVQHRPSVPQKLLDAGVPVIALADGATWSDLDFFDAANELGAVAVLQRPFPRTALLELVAAVLTNPAYGIALAKEENNRLGLAELMLRLDLRHFA